MLERHAQILSPVEPHEMGMLQRVFDEILTARGIGEDTDTASQAAADLISLFQHGIRDERQLLAMLSGRSFP